MTQIVIYIDRNATYDLAFHLIVDMHNSNLFSHHDPEEKQNRRNISFLALVRLITALLAYSLDTNSSPFNVMVYVFRDALSCDHVATYFDL